MWECECWQNFKTNEKTKNHIRSNFPSERTLSNESFLEKTRAGSVYGYVQGDSLYPDELKQSSLLFLQFSKTLKLEELISGKISKNYPTENDLFKHLSES